MRITEIKLNNYRAFYGEHTISLDKDGKNLMVYGENGSGKSSLFTALQNFFLSSVQKVNVEENIFVPASKKNTASILLTIKESATSTKTTNFELNCVDKQIISLDKTIIADANKIKGFFDYRSLLKTHIQHDNKSINLFDILVSNILYHSINRFSNQEIGKEWDKLYQNIFDLQQTSKRKNANIDYLQTKFNPGLKELLSSIEKDTNTFLNYFGGGIKVSFEFSGITYIRRKVISGNHIGLRIEFYNNHIPKHQFFLNEARLSALAISLYLASIKVNPTAGALKVLVLDDLLIGLDMSNRLPLLKILKNHFIEVPENERFQTIMTTYDKVWYELVRNFFGNEKWKYIEIFSKSLDDKDFEIPLIVNEKGYITRAKHYLAEKDYKASAVYIRTEFERIVKLICSSKKLLVVYKKNVKELTSEDYWLAITTQTNLDIGLIKELEIHRGTVMNPFSHYDLEKPEFEQELKDTIESIEKLITIINLPHTEPNFFKKDTTFDQLQNKIKSLENTISIKDKTIGDLRALNKNT